MHDGLGQHLTGIAFMTKVQEQKLKEKRLPYAADAAKIVKLVNEAINKTRELARGLEPGGFRVPWPDVGVAQLGAEVEDVFGVSCQLRCDTPVLIDDVSLATHLYHISQEAVSNAIKHGKAKKIEITLAADENRGVLTIQDDGSGCKKIPANSKGMGHHIMSHRAKMIGGTLDIHSCAPHGTVVSVYFRFVVKSSRGKSQEKLIDEAKRRICAQDKNLHCGRSPDRSRGAVADDESRA